VFHFAPRGSTVSEEGILTLETLPVSTPHRNKYVSRAKKYGMSVEGYLKHRRGEGGLRCVSVLYQVPPLHKCREAIRRFCLGRECWWIDYDALLEQHLIETSFLVESPLGMSVEILPRVLPGFLQYYSSESAWNNDNELIFKGCSHGILVIRGGRVPPELVKLVLK
jgi:hypothetical protein